MPESEPSGHRLTADEAIPFPPEAHRTRYTLVGDALDAWVVVQALRDNEAFLYFGPAGRGEGDSEPARLWQDTIDTLRAVLARAFDASGQPVAHADLRDLEDRLRGHIEAGDIRADLENGVPVLRALSLSAWLLARSAEDIHEGKALGTCETCGRRMVLSKVNQAFCSTRCRMQAHRARKKGGG